ncbi:hypothetical protein BDN72DRAFT_862738 [Pluteus cervinus]|uniref:Uncharacterized protein n=1 Tax=Pluteus cervinus TaxID=181527 RepID=A0ACD3AA18_9AGAR|nr:hypothetical protein BDN72DRAFT_862738 [Pluteus cervinus]
MINRPELKKIASKEFPGVLLEELVVRIDYTGYPPKLSLRNGVCGGLGSGGGEPTKDDIPVPPNAGDTELVDATTQEIDDLEAATASLTFDGNDGPTFPAPSGPSPHPKTPMERSLVIESSIPNGSEHFHLVTTTFTGGFWDGDESGKGVDGATIVTEGGGGSSRGRGGRRGGRSGRGGGGGGKQIKLGEEEEELREMADEVGDEPPELLLDEVDMMLSAVELKQGSRKATIVGPNGVRLLLRTEGVEIATFRKSEKPENVYGGVDGGLGG